MAINDSVDWALELGGGVRVALIQAGTFRSDAGALFGPVPRILWNSLVTEEIDHEHRLLQALNCLLVETPAGRVLVETGHRRAGHATKSATCAATRARRSCRPLRPPGSSPRPSTSWR